MPQHLRQRLARIPAPLKLLIQPESHLRLARTLRTRVLTKAQANISNDYLRFPTLGIARAVTIHTSIFEEYFVILRRTILIAQCSLRFFKTGYYRAAGRRQNIGIPRDSQNSDASRSSQFVSSNLSVSSMLAPFFCTSSYIRLQTRSLLVLFPQLVNPVPADAHFALRWCAAKLCDAHGL
ncbi:hypothetical protein GSD1FS_0601 [Bifidobacterium sp. GSD1FS]|uniref:Uncharacterized protein n=1 Tax=Bifidobacterium canis TaxID=2610880 RepID=A0A7K1J3R8_9BIFI|nr:hypothetical protein [Bifidobacterium canis]